MKFIKLGLISILFLGLLVTGISLLIPSTIVVQRSVEIDAPKATVFSVINNVKNWDKWLVNRDTLPIKVSRVDGFDVLLMGNTSIIITKVDSSSITSIWQVKKGDKMPGYFSLSRNNENGVTTLQFNFVRNIRWYPWEKFSSIVTDKVLGPFTEQNLENIKQLVEN